MTVISVIVGSTRQGRFSEKPARWIFQHLKHRSGIDAQLLDLRDFPMPFFDQPVPPAMPGRPPYENEVVKQWTAEIGRSDGFIFVTPEYNYGPAAVLKNALDYAEDLRMDERSYFDGIAVGVIACAGGWQAAVQTMGALREIAHALRGWPTPLGAALNTSVRLFDDAGECLDLSSKFQLENVGRQVVQFAAMRQGYMGQSAAVSAG